MQTKNKVRNERSKEMSKNVETLVGVEMERESCYLEAGITLIALIITIILMLILVGVSISLVIKGNLFLNAEKAVDGTNAKVEQEQSRVDELMQRLNTEVGKGSVKYNSSKMLDLQEGIMLCKTANETSGVKDIYSALNRVNELTHAATNETNTDEDRKALLSEIQELSKYIDRIRNNNQYKGEYLLNGKFARSIGAMKDAISLCHTAEGAISEIVSILDRIKSILGNNSLTEDNIKEIGQLVEELTRISLTTQFNKENLLDGTFARDIGKNGIYLEIIDCRGEALGLYSSTLEIDLSTTAGKEAYITKVENAITKLTKQKNDIENVQAQLEKLVNEA